MKQWEIQKEKYQETKILSYRQYIFVHELIFHPYIGKNHTKKFRFIKKNQATQENCEKI